MLFMGNIAIYLMKQKRLNQQCLGQRRGERHGARPGQQAGWWKYSQRHRRLTEKLVRKTKKRAMDVFSLRLQ